MITKPVIPTELLRQTVVPWNIKEYYSLQNLKQKIDTYFRNSKKAEPRHG